MWQPLLLRAWTGRGRGAWHGRERVGRREGWGCPIPALLPWLPLPFSRPGKGEAVEANERREVGALPTHLLPEVTVSADLTSRLALTSVAFCA